MKQEKAVKLAVARYINKEPYTVIGGVAGTGKSETVKYIIAALGFYQEQVAYIAYTGKAAKVLREKGCPNAMTAHKLLYKSILMPNGNYKFVALPQLEKKYKCIVVDEVSMLPKEMWDLLLTHKVYVIAMGDPEQLPPINPEENNHVLDNPHIFLTEIMRQAFDSEIIRLATHIREGNLLKDYHCDNEQCMVIDRGDLTDGMILWADQIICATNDNRNILNNYVRELKGFGEDPEPGDKIISLKNHWDILANDADQTPLTNGTILTLQQYNRQMVKVPKYIYEPQYIPLMITKANEDDAEFNGLVIDYNSIKNNVKTLNNKQEYMMKKNKTLIDPPLEFAYGYTITCWKAQGSQWNKILGFEEGFPRERELHRRYLYTLCTRAIDKLVLVKNK